MGRRSGAQRCWCGVTGTGCGECTSAHAAARELGAVSVECGQSRTRRVSVPSFGLPAALFALSVQFLRDTSAPGTTRSRAAKPLRLILRCDLHSHARMHARTPSHARRAARCLLGCSAVAACPCRPNVLCAAAMPSFMPHVAKPVERCCARMRWVACCVLASDSEQTAPRLGGLSGTVSTRAARRLGSRSRRTMQPERGRYPVRHGLRSAAHEGPPGATQVCMISAYDRARRWMRPSDQRSR